MPTPVATSIDPSAIASTCRGLAHPIRVRALVEFGDDLLSPSELTELLGEPRASLPTVAHHVRGLARAGLIELAAVTPRRGAIRHSYALTDFGRAVVDALERLPAP